jgi:hypothetical protein
MSARENTISLLLQDHVADVSMRSALAEIRLKPDQIVERHRCTPKLAACGCFLGAAAPSRKEAIPGIHRLAESCLLRCAFYTSAR